MLAEKPGQQLLVYDHGSGLGLNVPFFDSYATSEGFASFNNPVRVLAVCDALRHTFVDRGRDGRRVLCPKWGTLTCAEHIRCNDEFGEWHERRFGTQPGQVEEGFWLLGGEDADLTQLTTEADYQRLLEPPPVDVTPLEPRAEKLTPESARRMLAQPLPPVRDLAEGILLDLATDEEERLVLLEAIVRERPAWLPGLLPALVRQERIPTLAEAALRWWPEGFDPAAVVFASRWSTDGVVRNLARQILARDDPEFGRREEARAVVEGR